MRRLQSFKIIPAKSSTLLREAEPPRAVGVHHVFHPSALLFGTDARGFLNQAAYVNFSLFDRSSAGSRCSLLSAGHPFAIDRRIVSLKGIRGPDQFGLGLPPGACWLSDLSASQLHSNGFCLREKVYLHRLHWEINLSCLECQCG